MLRQASGSTLLMLQGVVSSVMWRQSFQIVLVILHMLGEAVNSRVVEVSGAKL
jgi:hypothetical protein